MLSILSVGLWHFWHSDVRCYVIAWQVGIFRAITSSWDVPNPLSEYYLQVYRHHNLPIFIRRGRFSKSKFFIKFLWRVFRLNSIERICACLPFWRRWHDTQLFCFRVVLSYMRNRKLHTTSTIPEILKPGINHEPPDVVCLIGVPYCHHEHADKRLVRVDGPYPCVFGVSRFAERPYVGREVSYLAIF